MYEPYPDSGPPQEVQRIQPPRSVRTAVKLMYTAAAIEVPTLIVALLTRASLKTAILAKHPDYTSAQLHTTETARTVSLVIGALIAIGLWLWMAWANGKGRSWARVLSAVFFGINTVDLIISFVLVQGAASQIAGIVIWLIGLAVIVLIFSKDSRPFYQQQAAQ
jgi:hypothetical protein